MTEPPAAPESFMPRTAFGNVLWALRQAAIEEAKQQGEALLNLEGIWCKVRERRGKRDFGADH